jgi:hypothetical protein
MYAWRRLDESISVALPTCLTGAWRASNDALTRPPCFAGYGQRFMHPHTHKVSSQTGGYRAGAAETVVIARGSVHPALSTSSNAAVNKLDGT